MTKPRLPPDPARAAAIARAVALLGAGWSYAAAAADLGVSRRRVQELERSWRLSERRAAGHAELAALVEAERARLAVEETSRA